MVLLHCPSPCFRLYSMFVCFRLSVHSEIVPKVFAPRFPALSSAMSPRNMFCFHLVPILLSFRLFLLIFLLAFCFPLVFCPQAVNLIIWYIPFYLLTQFLFSILSLHPVFTALPPPFCEVYFSSVQCCLSYIPSFLFHFRSSYSPWHPSDLLVFLRHTSSPVCPSLFPLTVCFFSFHPSPCRPSEARPSVAGTKHVHYLSV